jgi:hypothetical protein
VRWILLLRKRGKPPHLRRDPGVDEERWSERFERAGCLGYVGAFRVRGGHEGRAVRAERGPGRAEARRYSLAPGESVGGLRAERSPRLASSSVAVCFSMAGTSIPYAPAAALRRSE